MKKTRRDFKIISYYTGYIIVITAFLMIFPFITSAVFKEWDIALKFLISCSISLDIGIFFMIAGRKALENIKVEWKHGLIIASLSWIILMFLCALPYKLSGNYNSYLDACFDVMSGFTTTGLALIQNLDHVSLGINMWRHILTFVGGQGMVVLALSFLVKDASGAYKMYVGEGKDVELVPNIVGTAKIIWIISMIYLLIGTALLWVDGINIGLKPESSFFHALFITMSSWSTGGFSPMTQGIMYYHSFSYEIITIIFFIIGSLNFGLHYAVWHGERKEIIKNIETRSFAITSIFISFLAAVGLKKLNVYSGGICIFRRVVYNVLSAHTTTGFGNVYARQFAIDWGDYGVFLMIIAMLIGGSACSTAGGFKGLRVGIIFKDFMAQIKKLLQPERKIDVFKFHYMKDIVLEDGMVKSALFIVICYIITFMIGTFIGICCKYPLLSSAFECASATGNVGLSIGVTAPSMPAIMKIYYIIAMYSGRLEFVSVFVLIGFAAGGIKKLCVKY